MKWVVLVIVVILVAPTIAKRLEALDPERREQQQQGPQRKRGLVYRAVRRFGPRPVFAAFALLVVILVVVLYVIAKNL